MLTARTELNNKVQGFKSGADDYVTKPFDLYQLFARIKANLRRAPIFNRGAFPTVSLDPQNKLQQPNSETQRLHFGDLEIDLIYQRAVVRGKTLALSYKEFSVLSLLAQKVNQIISEAELHHWIWGTESNGDTRTLRVHISNLRKKLEAYPHLPSYIRNIRGQGYQFVWES
jgi:DNA-binding response OmpR family regulator